MSLGMEMSIFLAVIDLIKGVAWPFLIFGIALCFRKDIRELITRLTEVSPTGAKFDTIKELFDSFLKLKTRFPIS